MALGFTDEIPMFVWQVDEKTCALHLGPTLLLEETQRVRASRFAPIPMPNQLLPMILVINLPLLHLRPQLQVRPFQYNQLYRLSQP